jgi:hypothetical protein
MRFIPIVTAAIAALTTAVACTPADGADPNLASPPAASHAAKSSKSKPKLPKGMHAITYRIGGTASRALITYSTPSGQEQQNGAHVPWKHSMKAKDFTMLSVNAQNSGSGTITCEIDVDGKKVKASKSSGAYAVVSCDATLGF